MKKLLLLLTLLPLIATAQSYTTDDAWKDAQIANLKEKSEVAQQRSQWFRDARLGMFIHWDPSSVCGTEISWSKQFYPDDGENLQHNPRPTLKDASTQEHTDWISWFKPAIPGRIYDNLYKSFYPGMFNADSLVLKAKNAGMKYIVMVAKHHDGFCMWDTRYTDYNIMNSPFKRDILGELADACHRHNIRFGIYYSQRDWHHPLYASETLDQYNLYMRNQICELLTKYKPVDAIFFDAAAWNKNDSLIWEPEKMFKEIYAIAPNIIINNRCGVAGDYNTPEQKIGTIDMERDWESCMTFTGCWSWRGFTYDVIPLDKCLKYLVYCAGGNGNLLLNLGAMPTGEFDPREQNRLEGIGEWLSANGEAIYGTKGGPFRPQDWGVSTRKGNNIYIIVADWSKFNNTIAINKKQFKSAELLNGKALQSKSDNRSTTITVEPEDRSYLTIIKLTLSVDAEQMALMD